MHAQHQVGSLNAFGELMAMDVDLVASVPSRDGNCFLRRVGVSVGAQFGRDYEPQIDGRPSRGLCHLQAQRASIQVEQELGTPLACLWSLGSPQGMLKFAVKTRQVCFAFLG